MKWNYYNRAYLPDSLPHERVDISAINNGSIWKSVNCNRGGGFGSVDF